MQCWESQWVPSSLGISSLGPGAARPCGRNMLGHQRPAARQGGPHRQRTPGQAEQGGPLALGHCLRISAHVPACSWRVVPRVEQGCGQGALLGRLRVNTMNESVRKGCFCLVFLHSRIRSAQLAGCIVAASAAHGAGGLLRHNWWSSGQGHPCP